MPGLTDASGFPKMWAGTGRNFPTVIDELISLAFERHQDKIEKQNKAGKLILTTRESSDGRSPQPCVEVRPRLRYEPTRSRR